MPESARVPVLLVLAVCGCVPRTPPGPPPDPEPGPRSWLIYGGGECLTEVPATNQPPTIARRACTGAADQQVEISFAADFTMKFAASGDCADLPEDIFRPGYVIQTVDCDGSAGQQFHYRTGSSFGVEHLKLLEPHGNYCMSATPLDRSLRTGACDDTTVPWHALPAQSPATPPPAPTPLVTWTIVHDHSVSPPTTRKYLTVRGIDNALFERGFRFYSRRGADAEWKLLATRGEQAGARTTMDEALHEFDLGIEYTFKIVAFNDAGETESREVAFFADVPAAPSDVEATDITHSSVRMVWEDNSNNEDRFIAFSSPRSGEPKTVDRNRRSVTFQGLEPDTEYQFLVYAENEYGQSGNAWVRARTLTRPVPPQLPNLTVELLLVWPPVPMRGEPFEITWSECNTGTKASGTYTSRLYLDAAVLQSYSQSLQPGTCFNRLYAHPGIMNPSSFPRLRAVVDPDGAVAESSEADNWEELGL